MFHQYHTRTATEETNNMKFLATIIAMMLLAAASDAHGGVRELGLEAKRNILSSKLRAMMMIDKNVEGQHRRVQYDPTVCFGQKDGEILSLSCCTQ